MLAINIKDLQAILNIIIFLKVEWYAMILQGIVHRLPFSYSL